MPFDATVLTALKPELDKLCGSRVLKIYQPARLELVLMLRSEGENVRLLMSAHPERARLHITTRPQANPLTPPAFCMYLRRHLEGARLSGIRRPPGERIVGLKFEGRDELGERSELELIAEIMGKHSNIILVNNASGLILEAIKHVTEEINRFREVLPGRPYRTPPAQNKALLEDLTELAFYSELQAQKTRVIKALVATVAGFSPLLAREVVARAGLDEELNVKEASRADLEKLWQALTDLREQIDGGKWRPTVYLSPEGKVLEVTPFPLTLMNTWPKKTFPAMSAALDFFYGKKEEEERFTTTRQNLLTWLKRTQERVEKKLGLHLEAIREASASENYRRFGELLLANLYRVPPGAAEVELEDWETGTPVRIPLDPRLTPAQNAQIYFRRFAKAKKTLLAAREQAARDREELTYLESIALALEEAEDLADLEEIRTELEKEGYLKKPEADRTGKPAQQTRSEPLTFYSSAGWT
ncbi:MAG: hypothetical protein PWQ13_372, partial [Bacillota bacterium]|nr:hypothetical protein [Bacillota bacterium]